jgi:hypothetical protein
MHIPVVRRQRKLNEMMVVEPLLQLVSWQQVVDGELGNVVHPVSNNNGLLVDATKEEPVDSTKEELKDSPPAKTALSRSSLLTHVASDPYCPCAKCQRTEPRAQYLFGKVASSINHHLVRHFQRVHVGLDADGDLLRVVLDRVVRDHARSPILRCRRPLFLVRFD